MRILTFNWHTPYLSLLTRLNHQFEVAPANIEPAVMANWDETMRPIPPNVKLISTGEAREKLAVMVEGTRRVRQERFGKG